MDQILFKTLSIKTDEKGNRYAEGIGWDQTIYQLHPFGDGVDYDNKFVVIGEEGKQEWDGFPPAQYFSYYKALLLELVQFFESEKKGFAQRVAAKIQRKDLTIHTNKSGTEFVSYLDAETDTLFTVYKVKQNGYSFTVESPKQRMEDWDGSATVYKLYQPVFDRMMVLCGWVAEVE